MKWPTISESFTLSILTFSLIQSVLAADNDTDLDYDPKSIFGYSPRRDLPFPDLVEYDGYDCESHTVTTSDGYILGLYRIPLKASCEANEDRIPLIFMHGLYLSGDDCIIPGPGDGHCYIYADACYDVWVPNNRGNRYSRKHVSLDPDTDEEFWDISLEDMALKDLPAIIDYVLENTGKTQVNYVAHSQGVAILLILCAKQPEYNNKIKAGFGLSVTAHLQHSRFIVIPIQALAATIRISRWAHFEILATGSAAQTTGKLLCGISEVQYPFCSLVLFAALGYNQFQIPQSTFAVLTGHVPAGTAYDIFEQWGTMRKYGFVERDLGAIKNLKSYGSLIPPLIDLSAVEMPWYFIGSENDYVGDLRDIAVLQSQLSNVSLCVLADKTFGHLDFIYGKDIKNFITPKILTTIEGGSFVCD